jgi:murein DD-endopeptidase MepM/ murein hydrolase activator NlpD
MPKSPGLWGTLKARLTGRPNEYGNYSSYVNITEADADRLIANMKKDPRGYPQLDQSSGTPSQWLERQRIYQEWLVEEYLEKPFRKQVDAKIEEAEIERVVNKRRSENIQPQEPLVKPMEPIPDPWEGSYVNSSEIKTPEPVIEPEPEPVVETPPPETESEVPTTDETPKKPIIPDLIPTKIPNKLSQNISEFSNALDNIASELSAHNVLIKRRTSILKTSNANLDLVKFLLGQQIENYSEFLNDIETRSREDEIENKDDKVTSTVVKQPEETSPLPVQTAENKPQKQWWEFWKQDSNKSPTKASAGLMSTSMPAMSKGGISLGTGDKNILKPGIYDNPTVGNLAPGTAIIPLNRNYGKDMFGNYDEIEYLNALGDTMMLPMRGLLGSVLSVYGDILSSLGPLAGFFNSSLPGIVQGASNILGIPVNLVLDMLGGPGYAGTMPNELEERKFYKSWKIYFDNNRLIFEGGTQGSDGEEPSITSGEIAKDIGVISSAADLRYVGGTNVGKLPAWIPFAKSDTKKIGYVSGFGFRWGKQHSGIDLDGDPGIKIISPFAGKIYDINRNWPTDGGGGYGNLVGIEHKQPKIFTFYGHLKDVASRLEVGTEVKAGEVIGTVGNTGHSFGAHLHWEVRKEKNGGQVDPVEWTHQNKPSFAKGGGWRLPSLPTLLPSPIDLVKGLMKPKQSKRNFGEDYKRQELILSAKASGGSGLADIRGNQRVRPQQSGSISRPKDSTRVKQSEPQVPKIDPDLTPLQNWAKLFPELAKKVKPGQSGYEEIQKILIPKSASMPPVTSTTTAVATESKAPPKETTIQMPSAPSTPNVVTSGEKSQVSFVQLDMDTNYVKELMKLRRIQ